jgi:predicted transcriptional regulator
MKKSELKQLIKEEIEKVLNEAKKTFKLKIINKNGFASIQQVSADTSTTELFDIVALIKKSPKVEDVKILED